MATPDAKKFDFLTGAEGDYMGVVMSQLADVPWAKPLISDIEAAGGLKGENKAKLFELRFGHELHGAGIQPQYTKESLREPAVACIAPARPPTIAHQDGTLTVDLPVADRNDGMTSVRLRLLAGRRIDDTLRVSLIEGTRQHRQDDHRTPLIQFLDDAVDRVDGGRAVTAVQLADLARRRP